jgi:uncharacterized membrane protein YfcA
VGASCVITSATLLLAALVDLLEPGAARIETIAWLVGAALLSGALAYFGAMVGLVLGQFRLPLLLLALGSAPAAAATNLAISSLGAGTGAWTHSREGRVELRLLLSIGIPSAGAAYITSRSLDHVEAWWIGTAIGVTLLVSAVPLARRSLRLRRAESENPSEADKPEAAAEPGGPRSKQLLAIEIVIGAVLGALSGVVGLLLGTLRLPAMLRLGVSPQQAAGTNMAIGFFTGVAGALGAVGSGRVSWLALLVVGSTTVLGAVLGARRTKRLPVAWHYGLIAVVLTGVAFWLIGTSLASGLG